MPKMVTKFPKSEFYTVPTEYANKVQLVHRTCGSVRVLWKSNLAQSYSCAKCSVRAPADDKAFLLVNPVLATFVGVIPADIPSNTSVYWLQPNGLYRIADEAMIAAGQAKRPPKPTLQPLNPRTPKARALPVQYTQADVEQMSNPWALPKLPQAAPVPNTGYRQFLAMPAKYAPYITGTVKLSQGLEDEAEAYTAPHIGEDYLGEFVAGEEWEHEGVRYQYCYVPVADTATLVPTGAGGSPLRTTTEES